MTLAPNLPWPSTIATIGMSSWLPVTLIATDFLAKTTLLSFVVCLKDKKYSPFDPMNPNYSHDMEDDEV